MSYKLRFVQQFDKKDMDVFLKLERKFIEWEKNAGLSGAGRRYLPVAGREPVNTLIWEAEVPTMDEVMRMMEQIEGDKHHDALVAEQVVYMKDYYVEILKTL